MESPRRARPRSANPAAPHLRTALHLLLQAWDHARQSRRDVWNFAVEIADLRATGLARSDLRWLISMRYVQHAIEESPLGAERRVFGRVGTLVFRDRSCFVLTEEGARFARTLEAGASSDVAQAPFYDKDRRELRVGSRLVKAFRQPAPAQHTILSAFQELRWPARIDDPLPREPDQEPKLRLREAIKRLNRHQQHRVIRFRADGEGKGILWEIIGAYKP